MSKELSLSNKQSVDNIDLLRELRELIEEARAVVALTVNAGLTMLYWQIGDRISREVLSGKRGNYGKEIIATLSQQLSQDYGNGYSYSALTRMIKFVEVFPDQAIITTLSQTLSWSHFREILPLNKPLQRDFYAEMCRVERWSVRTLRKKIGSMLYERTALSKKPEELIKLEIEELREKDSLTPDLVFRDPYFLDFLGLKNTYQEKDLESAILHELESFIMELGSGFTFMARQKRLTVDNDDFYLDLLFYHRDLQRLVVIELKLDRFRPEHKGQMELYLRWLDKYERKEGEKSPLGIILCSGKDDERIELLELGQSGIHVAEYLTELPTKEILKEKLHSAIKHSRERLTGGEKK